MLENPKGSLLNIFRHCDTFQISNFLFIFPKIFKCPQRVNPSIFLTFCNKLDCQKSQKVSLFTILKILRFLSLRYSADFRRSRLVFKMKNCRRIFQTVFPEQSNFLTSAKEFKLLSFDIFISNKNPFNT